MEYRIALETLPGITFMPEAPYGTSNRWLTVILIDPSVFGADRETVRLALEAQNIESRPVWKPMHLQPVFETMSQRQAFTVHGSRFTVGKNKTIPCRVVGGSIAEGLFDKGLCLPSGTAMTDADVQRTIEVMVHVHQHVNANS